MNIQFLIPILSVAILCSPVVFAREIVVVFSPYQPQEALHQHVKSTLKFLTSLEAGDNAILMDGFNLRTIATFKVPQGKAYRSPKLGWVPIEKQSVH